MSDNDIIENIKEITVYFDYVIMCHIGDMRIAALGNGVGRTLLAGFAYESHEMGIGLVLDCKIGLQIAYVICRCHVADVILRIVMKLYRFAQRHHNRADSDFGASADSCHGIEVLHAARRGIDYDG